MGIVMSRLEVCSLGRRIFLRFSGAMAENASMIMFCPWSMGTGCVVETGSFGVGGLKLGEAAKRPCAGAGNRPGAGLGVLGRTVQTNAMICIPGQEIEDASWSKSWEWEPEFLS